MVIKAARSARTHMQSGAELAAPLPFCCTVCSPECGKQNLLAGADEFLVCAHLTASPAQARRAAGFLESRIACCECSTIRSWLRIIAWISLPIPGRSSLAADALPGSLARRTVSPTRTTSLAFRPPFSGSSRTSPWCRPQAPSAIHFRWRRLRM